MTKKKPPDKLKKRGRKTDRFKQEYCELGYQLTLLGLDDSGLARHFNVSLTTVSNWKNRHPNFLESIKKGKEKADSKVAASLYTRACGYDFKETKIKECESGLIETTVTNKHMPADVGAIALWLKNRQPNLWRDRPEPKKDDHSDSPDKKKLEKFATENGLSLEEFCTREGINLDDFEEE